MILVGGFLAFVVTIVFLFSLRPLAEAVGLVDVPGGRKRHIGRVPLIGGIAMSLGWAFALNIVPVGEPLHAVVVAAFLLVVLGVIDDRFDLPAASRFLAQGGAALYVILGADIRVTDLGSPLFFHVSLGVFSIPFTLLFILTVINAYNMVDGLDGLAGGLVLLALVAMAVFGHGTLMFPLLVVLAATVAAFLVFNLPMRFNRPVRVFMGDAGSTALGFVVACLGIKLFGGAAPGLSPCLGLWMVAVPVFDLFAAVVRRVLSGKSPFAADHQHLHHGLVTNGVSRRMALVTMLTLAAIGIGIGAAGYVFRIPDGVMVPAWFVAGALYYGAVSRPRSLAGMVLFLNPRRHRVVAAVTARPRADERLS